MSQCKCGCGHGAGPLTIATPKITAETTVEDVKTRPGAMDVLQRFGLGPASFAGFGKLLQGTRRHNLVYLDGLTAEATPHGLSLAFALPAGSYATVLLREVMKSPAEPEEEPAGEEG